MKQILVVGGGPIGIEYCRIFSKLSCQVTLLAKEENPAAQKTILQKSYELPSGYLSEFDGIVLAVQPDKTCEALIDLIRRTSCPILVEKPIALSKVDLDQVGGGGSSSAGYGNAVDDVWSRVYVAFNRRFFSSVTYIRELLENQKILGCEFCFTEIEERVVGPDGVKQRWMLANSIHVFDLATHIAGYPVDLVTSRSGTCKWHTTGSEFVGYSRIDNGYMNFSAYWGSAGNWEVSFITADKKYILNPLETVLVQDKGSIKREAVVLEQSADGFKPGFYDQATAFLNQEREKFISAKNYIQLHEFISTVAGYE